MAAQSKSLDTHEVEDTPQVEDTPGVEDSPRVEDTPRVEDNPEVEDSPEVGDAQEVQSKNTGEEDGFPRKLYCTIFFKSDKTFDIIPCRKTKTHKIGDKITVRSHHGLVVGMFGKL